MILDLCTGALFANLKMLTFTVPQKQDESAPTAFKDASFTCFLCSSSGPSNVIIRLTIRQNNKEIFVSSIFHWPKHISGCERNGITSRSAAAHVANVPDSREDLFFRGVVGEAELGTLVVRELHSCNLGADVRDLKSLRNVADEFQHKAEVAFSDAAGTIDQETDVDRVVARLATQHLLM